MKEKIKFEVTFLINYTDNNGRKEAIKNAKKCCLSMSILSYNGGAKPVKANLIK